MQAIKSAAQQSKFQALVILLIIAFISSIQLAFGQGIKGTVTDKESGEPIPFANVVVPSGSDNTLLGVATDVDGKFWIPLEAGSYDLNVSFVGYDQLEIKDIQVGKGDTLSVELLIVTSVTQLDAFVVSAEQEQLKFEKSYTVQSTVTRRELNAIRSVSPGVLASPLKALPGVVMRSAPKISIRARREKAIETPDLATLESEEALPENGGLTAGEIKDFGKWDLWNDISKKVLSFGKEQWKVDPSLRYAVQVKTTDGFPAVDYEVQLVTKTGEVIFTTHTNNAGAAELWSSLFEDQEANPIIVVLHQGVRLAEQKAILFKKGINQISIHKECEVPSAVDLMFVVDATGSMEDEINHLKSELKGIIEGLDQTDVNIRSGSVFYRCFGNSYVTSISEFSSEISTIIDFIGDQEASEGGMEAVEEALDQAINGVQWSERARARLLFLILDEPPGNTEAILDRLHKSMLQAAAKGIHIIPIVASGTDYTVDKSLQYLMRSIAMVTNGSYVFLTDHSGIGDKHTVPSTDEYDVELFKELMPRLISEFIYVPSCERAAYVEMKDTVVVVIRGCFLNVGCVNGVELDEETLVNEEATGVEPAEIEENERDVQEVSFSYFPNPTSGLVTVEIEGEIDVLYIADISGRLLQRIPVRRKHQIQVDLSAYPRGIYHLQFHDGKKIRGGKVVLQY